MASTSTSHAAVASTATMSHSKSPSPPSPPTYSHLLYVSEAERRQHTASAAPSSVSSLRSSSSMHSLRSTCSSYTSAASVRSKASIPTPRFVDDHYPLITTIHPEALPAAVPEGHSALWCARQMAQIHNTIIRAVNASWNHSVHVKPDSAEAADFLRFNQVLFKILDHHHHVEDDFMFPALEQLLDRPGAMEENVQGHESFAAGLAVFEKYVAVTQPAEYNGTTFRHIIESFAPALIQHLHDEIPTLRDLHVLDSKALMKVWKQTEHLATKDADLYVDAPWILGCQDKAFVIDGRPGDFPGLPWVIEAGVRNWFARRHAGAWNFCPSDLCGQRRLMIPE